MSDSGLEIGRQIRKYRKEREMTLQELADRVNKSKSTVSKYECGEVSIDIDTIREIAEVLHVHIFQLIGSICEKSSLSHLSKRSKFFPGASKIHIYYYDGRINRVRHGVIDILYENADNSQKIMIDLNVGEHAQGIGVEYVSPGTMTSYDIFTLFTLEQHHGMGNGYIYAYNPFGSSRMVNGLFMCVAKNPIAPVALKIILSCDEIVDCENLKEQLKFTTETLKWYKKINMMVIDNRI